MYKILPFILFIILLNQSFANNNFVNNKDWHLKKTPTLSSANIFGFYSAGCLDGAVKLAAIGDGYKLVRLNRKRNYAHPDMKKYIEYIGSNLKTKYNRYLLVSDLSQARGGPLGPNSSHRSHQTGLDVDIWYKTSKLKNNEKNQQPYSVLNDKQDSLNYNNWSNIQEYILKESANYEKISRIFVTASVKKHLCTKYKDSKWLHKIRPWWGHDKHFHVRMLCPDGSLECKNQFPVTKSNECDESLDWWFSDEAKITTKPEEFNPILPKQCGLIFKQ